MKNEQTIGFILNKRICLHLTMLTIFLSISKIQANAAYREQIRLLKRSKNHCKFKQLEIPLFCIKQTHNRNHCQENTYYIDFIYFFSKCKYACYAA